MPATWAVEVTVSITKQPLGAAGINFRSAPVAECVIPPDWCITNWGRAHTEVFLSSFALFVACFVVHIVRYLTLSCWFGDNFSLKDFAIMSEWPFVPVFEFKEIKDSVAFGASMKLNASHVGCLMILGKPCGCVSTFRRSLVPQNLLDHYSYKSIRCGP